MELTRAAARSLARTALGERPIDEITPIGVGFANDNWMVTDRAGNQFVLKLGPRSSAPKWTSAGAARDRARAVGIPCPRVVHDGVQDDVLVRVFEWIDGAPAASIDVDPARVARFGTDLGAAVAALHSIDVEGFSSRLDGSAPVFEQWDAYVDHRLQQVRERCAAAAAPDPATIDRACSVILDLVAAAGDSARPTLCHRDLHPDNLLVDGQGHLVAVLDWDMAEIWDQAGDWFKLDGRLFPAIPALRGAFEDAYRSVHPDLPAWSERTRLVDLLETLNSVANAELHGWPELGSWARVRLEDLLDPT